MTWPLAYLGAAGDLLADLWLYMLAGFLVAGIVEEFVPEARLLRYFGSNDAVSLLRGIAAGFVVSACSCGAIPLVATLRRRGASTATALAFLLASPWLGVPMLLVYVSFLGVPRTVALIGLSMLVALTTGLLLARLERRGLVARGSRYGGVRQTEADPAVRLDENGCGTSCAAGEAEPALGRRLLVGVPRNAWSLGKDIGLYLLIGVLLAAVAKAFVPSETVARLLGASAGPAALAAALPVAVAIEACSEGFAVVAGQLYKMGATLAVVFLVTMVGVATDVTELAVLWKKFGPRTTLTYVGIGTGLTIVIALALQFVA